MLERLVVGILALQTIGIQQECVYHSEDDGRHIRVVVSGLAPESLSPQWITLIEVGTGNMVSLGDIERNRSRFEFIVDGHVKSRIIMLMEGEDYSVELRRGGDLESGDIIATLPFTTKTCD